MTLLVSWIGTDDKKKGKSIASLYLASDSRYSWGPAQRFDLGSKVFGSTRFPEIFGFWGDVSFPTTVLSQLITQIDSRLLLNEEETDNNKNVKIFEYIRSSFDQYPKHLLAGNFTILHGTRVAKTFTLFVTSFAGSYGLTNQKIDLPIMSSVVNSGGSGSGEYERNWVKWKDEKHNNFGTSRAVYHCVEETINSSRDGSTGGVPQVIGLYRIGNARVFGIVHGSKRFLYGKEVSDDLNVQNIEWRNENFERADPYSLTLLEGAQRQPPS